jgi:hypothetical protein
MLSGGNETILNRATNVVVFNAILDVQVSAGYLFWYGQSVEKMAICNGWPIHLRTLYRQKFLLDSEFVYFADNTGLHWFKQ